MLNLPIQTSFYGFCLCQSSFTTDLYLLQKPTAESKAPCLKDQPDPPPIPSPIVCHCPKVRVTPEVHGELSNPREEERSLREQGWCTGSHYRLWWCSVQAWLGEPAPQRLLIMGKSSCPGASGRREKRGWDMKTWHASLFGSAGTIHSSRFLTLLSSLCLIS